MAGDRLVWVFDQTWNAWESWTGQEHLPIVWLTDNPASNLTERPAPVFLLCSQMSRPGHLFMHLSANNPSYCRLVPRCFTAGRRQTLNNDLALVITNNRFARTHARQSGSNPDKVEHISSGWLSHHSSLWLHRGSFLRIGWPKIITIVRIIVKLLSYKYKKNQLIMYLKSFLNISICMVYKHKRIKVIMTK